MRNNTPKQKVTVVLPRSVIEHLRAIAKQHRRSFTSELLWAIEQYLANHPNPEETT